MHPCRLGRANVRVYVEPAYHGGQQRGLGHDEAISHTRYYSCMNTRVISFVTIVRGWIAHTLCRIARSTLAGGDVSRGCEERRTEVAGTSM